MGVKTPEEHAKQTNTGQKTAGGGGEGHRSRRRRPIISRFRVTKSQTRSSRTGSSQRRSSHKGSSGLDAVAAYVVLLAVVFVLMMDKSMIYYPAAPAEEALPVFSHSQPGQPPPALDDRAGLFQTALLWAERNLGFLLGNKDMLKQMLNSAVPTLRYYTSDAVGDRQPGSILDWLLELLFSVRIADPASYLASQIPMLETVDYATAVASSADLGQTTWHQWGESGPSAGQGSGGQGASGDGGGTPGAGGSADQGSSGSSGPLIGIYHTHAKESFIPLLPNPDRRQPGEAFTEDLESTVVMVGELLAGHLAQDYGLKVVTSSVMHDRNGRVGAYIESLKTAEEMISRYPSIQLLLDLHRDAARWDQSTVTIAGTDYARVMIVLGQDQQLPHPAWKENLQCAYDLTAIMDRLYPGLSRGILPKPGRYNQHLMKGALLFEIGGVDNDLPELDATARALAHVLAIYIEENLKER